MRSPAAPARFARRVATAAVWLALQTVLAWPLPAAAQRAPQADRHRALLTLTVNGVDKGEILAVVCSGDILVEVAALDKAGLLNVKGRRETFEGRAVVSLASLAPGIRYEFSEEALTLKLTAGLDHLGTATVDLRQARPAFEYARTTSAFANYGLNWASETGGNASLETGLSLGPALATSTVSWDRSTGLVRGLSSVTVDDRARLRRWTIGDSLVSARTLGSGLVLGGVHLSREYGLDPYFVQFPTQQLSGSALTPSTVEVYVNDRLVSRQQVAPGSFDLANIPMPTGGNSTRVVVRDAFGREQEATAPYYLTTTVLARGLQDFDYAVGYPRTGGVAANWNYSHLSAIARHRYGFTGWLTAGFAAETDNATAMGGPTLNLKVPAGEMEIAASASRSHGVGGTAASVAYTRMGRTVSLAARLRSMTAGFSSLTVSTPQQRMRVEASGEIGLRLGTRTSASLQEAWSESHAGVRQGRTLLVTSVRVSDKASVFTNVGGVRESGRTRPEVFVGLSLNLGERTTASVGGQRSEGASSMTAGIQRSVPVGTGFGYRLQSGVGGQNLVEGMVEAQGPYGRWEAGQEVLDGKQSPHVAASGGLVAIGGGVHATRPVTESYALVRVPEVGGVRTYLDNQEVGRTNGHGDVLVPNLLPYYANRVGIADEDVPIDHEVERVERAVAPPLRGGAIVVFEAARRRSVSGTLALEVDGQVLLPAFGELTVSAGDRVYSSPIGSAGQFYLEHVAAGVYAGAVRFKGVTYRISLEVPRSDEPEVRLGIVRCVVPDAHRAPLREGQQ